MRAVRGATGIGKTYSLPGKYRAKSKLNVRVEVRGTDPTTIRAKVWLKGKREPSTWQIVARDSTTQLQAAGTVGIKARSSSALKTSVKFSVWTYKVTEPK